MSARHRNTELVKAARHQLKIGGSFTLACNEENKDYWYNILSLHFSHAKVIQTENGIEVRKNV